MASNSPTRLRLHGKSRSLRSRPWLSLLILLAASGLLSQSHAITFSPGELIVKLRHPPVRNSLDQIESSGIAGLDRLVSEQRANLSSPFEGLTRRFPQVEPVVLVRVSSTVPFDSLETALRSDAEVEWVTRNYHYRTNDGGAVIPNDSLFSAQWWLRRISAPEAWEITRGDTGVIIGIMDTGIDLLHPDIRPNLWINWADADSDGDDDDHNGFVDDVYGWDFVDAPSLPSAGDHLVRDNDPSDEMGHGTFVAGLASAATDNGQCVASVGYSCRLMALRAANAEGFLEEDDVAAALLYAAQMRAEVASPVVVNMSFGDVVASPLLRETVRIAFEQGVTMVASAGNSNSDLIHYPSGYPEVISVGAVGEDDRRAPYSNYGPMVDVMAPGEYLLSTFPDSGCGEWIINRGTSYAAPLVSGAAGLLLSINAQLTPADIKQIIRSSCDDIREAGWDSATVHGRLNARRAVEQARYGADAVARITHPRTDEGVLSDFAVFGEAWGPSFDHYDLLYGLGDNPVEWIPVCRGESRVLGDSLGWIHIPDVDTVLTVRLETHGTEGSLAVDHVHLYLQRRPPSLDSMRVRRMLDQDTYGDLVQVWTNQYTAARMLLTNEAGDSVREDFGYVSRTHASVLSQSEHPGRWQVRVRLENPAGLYTDSEPFVFEVNDPPFSSNLWQMVQTNLITGYLGPFTTDFNCNGWPEVWLMPLLAGDTLGLLQVHEWDGSRFTALPFTYGFHFPQAVADADGDGLLEMMARFSDTTRIWEQSEPCGPLNHLVFERTENCLGAGFIDLDSTDTRLEIVVRQYTRPNQLERARYVIYAVGDNYTVTAVDTVPNNTQGSNELGSPKFVAGDLDQDGLLDFLYGDYDGDLVFCERSGGRFVQKWSRRLPLNDATSWTAAGDFDGDGQPEFVGGCRSNVLGGSESQRRSRHWEYFVFERAADDSFTVADSIFIIGDENLTEHASSIEAADVDGDGRAEILICAYPDFYIVKWDPASGRYRPQWYHFPAELNTALVSDWDRDGLLDFLFTDGARFSRVSAAAAFGRRPPPPLYLSGEPLGPSSVHLTWTRVIEADSYRVYQADQSLSFVHIATVSDTAVTIADLPDSVEYVYAISSLSDDFPDFESVLSNHVALMANWPPAVNDTAHFQEPGFVDVRFSEGMGPSSLHQWSYRLEDGRMPAVVSPGENGRVVYLTFDGGLADGWHRISLHDLRDAQGTRLPPADSLVVFEVRRVFMQTPHISEHHVLGGPRATRVEVTFSEPMSASVTEVANYRAEAPRNVIAVHAKSADNHVVEFELDSRYPVGALGLRARILLRNLTNLAGVFVDTTGGRADLVLDEPAVNLSEAYVFPNPFKGLGAGGEEGVIFAALPETATIRVFTLQGLLVRKLEHHDLTGGARWDLTNEDGRTIASGVYIYIIESGGQTVRGKLAVVR